MPSSHSDPLQFVRVVDLSRLVAGNMVSHLLADFGADVIKVEKPGSGDDLRKWSEQGIEIFWKVYRVYNPLIFQILASIKKGPSLFKPFSKARWNVSAVSAIAASTPIPFAI